MPTIKDLIHEAIMEAAKILRANVYAQGGDVIEEGEEQDKIEGIESDTIAKIRLSVSKLPVDKSKVDQVLGD